MQAQFTPAHFNSRCIKTHYNSIIDAIPIILTLSLEIIISSVTIRT
jgi:hypothetical protein